MRTKQVKFKPYNQGQLMVLPPSFEDLIPSTHPARVVNQVIDKINLNPLMATYKGGGTSSYHPRMLLKVLVYCYLCNLYSSRKIEAALQENIHFMWLSAMEKPDHNTINRFRSERMKEVIQEVFSQVVLMLVDSGHIDLQRVYTDGTKIEANANRYTFVWGNSIKNNKQRIKEQLEELWAYTQEIASEELKDTAPVNFTSINPETVRQTIEQIDQALKDKPADEKVKQKVKYAKKNWPDKLEEYQEKEKILKERNSFSKTDPDATFMRMKEDHMQNGQLKPGYNVQISTNKQFIGNYSIHQSTTDTTTLRSHLVSFEKLYGFMPEELTADAGYGSQENYEFLENNGIEGYVKDNYFDKTQHGKDDLKREFHPDNLFYNKSLDCYYCPMAQPMVFIGYETKITKTGYRVTLSRYQAQNCEGCPLHGRCHTSKENWIIEVSHRGNELRNKARERLRSEKGINHRKQRPVDVEPVFGIIKHNRGFKRFMLRGLNKVEIEFGLLAIAHNLKKIA